MPVKRKTIEGNLPKKGFIREDTHHRYFYHEYNGKRTGAYTYTSHGTKYTEYGVGLLKRMKNELKLNNIKQVIDLCECPIDAEQYNDILRNSGNI